MSGSVDPLLFAAFTTGLLGGFGHCIGMCGPVVGAFALSGPSGRAAVGTFGPQFLYHAGRIATYSLIGAFMGLSGSFLNVAGRIAGVQNAVAVLTGIVMVLMGLNVIGVWGSAQWIERHNSLVLLTARRVAGSNAPARSILLGAVLGLMPCGLSYTMFIASAGSGGAFRGLAVSLLFGLGTLPGLAAFGALISMMSSRLRGSIYRAGGVLVICIGLYYLWKGLQLYAGL